MGHDIKLLKQHGGPPPSIGIQITRPAENHDGGIALDTIGFYVDWRNYGGGLIVHETAIN